MKAQLTALILAISLFATADRAKAEVWAPEGCHFEIQVKYVGAIRHPHRPTLMYSYWERYGSQHQLLGKAEDVYEVLAYAKKTGKLAHLLGLSNSSRKYPVDVQLLFVCKSATPLKADTVVVLETTVDSR